MKYFFLYFILAACIGAALFSCSSPVLGDEEDVVLSANSSYEQAASWRIVYGSDFSEEKTITVKNLDHVVADLQKNTPSYILAYPISENGKDLSLPYGAIPPFSTKISPKDGFAASILKELYCSSEKTEEIAYNIKHFNWLRFMEICREYENPWLINRSRIISAIHKGKFKKSDIKIDVKRN